MTKISLTAGHPEQPQKFRLTKKNGIELNFKVTHLYELQDAQLDRGVETIYHWANWVGIRFAIKPGDRIIRLHTLHGT
ncbi:hypothetical protein [Desulfocicer niacini]